MCQTLIYGKPSSELEVPQGSVPSIFYSFQLIATYDMLERYQDSLHLAF